MIEAAFLSIPIQTVSFNLFLVSFVPYFLLLFPNIYVCIHSHFTFDFFIHLFVILSEFLYFPFAMTQNERKKFPNRMWKLGKHTRIDKQKNNMEGIYFNEMLALELIETNWPRVFFCMHSLKHWWWTAKMWIALRFYVKVLNIKSVRNKK